MASSGEEVAVLGAGIMGCCLALELARRGRNVVLMDRAPAPMTGASLHNEGKLHLGFVYAKDASGETHRRMLSGSLAFSRIIASLTGSAGDLLAPSQPFHYFVASDSQLGMASIHEHFQRVEDAFHEEVRRTGDLYLGRTVRRTFEQNPQELHTRLFSGTRTLGSFRTEEVSVSPAAVANILCRAIEDHPNIRFVGRTEVASATRLQSGDVEIEFLHAGALSSSRFASVANCLWEDRLRIDRTAGIADEGAWVIRYKATIAVSDPGAVHAGIPSVTGVLGSYGDVVNHGNGEFYVSWYPLCKLAQSVETHRSRVREGSHEGTPPRDVTGPGPAFPSPAEWNSPMDRTGFIDRNIAEMAAFVPSMNALLSAGRRCRLAGGIIVARGETDIDDPDSFLHRRSEIGPQAHGTYVTVDTGKYCMAPLFAFEAADLVSSALT